MTAARINYKYIYLWFSNVSNYIEMATHSSILAWRTPWREEPGRPQSMGSQRVGHDWVTSLSLSLSCFGEGNGNPLQCSCLENPRDGAAWWAAVSGVAQSWTRLSDWTELIWFDLNNVMIITSFSGHPPSVSSPYIDVISHRHCTHISSHMDSVCISCR